MSENFIKGSWVALVTPFKDGQVDFASVKKLVELHLNAGTDGLLICGTTGEAATMSFSEKKELMKVVVDEVKGRIPIMFGSGSNNTAQAEELTSKAEELGASAALVVCPYYNKPTQQGIKAHFRKVASATSLPVVLYNVPGRTGMNMLAETSLELAEISNITAIKEASGNLNQIMEIIKKAPEGFNVLSGDDALNLPIMACGAKGTISVTANVDPFKMKQFNDAALSANWDEARRIHYSLLDLHHGLFIESNPLPAKAAMTIKGYMDSEARLPLTRPSDSTTDFMKNLLKQLEN